MDWQGSMGMFDHFAQPQQEEEADEDNEDFYGDEDTKVGAAEEDDAGDLLNSLLPPHTVQQQTPSKAAEPTMTADERKAENQRQAELLRAKLIAKRQGTPMKPTVSRPEMPAQIMTTAVDSIKTPATVQPETAAPSSDSLGLDSLIAEGKRAAEAKLAQTNGYANHQTRAIQTKQSTPPDTETRKIEQQPVQNTVKTAVTTAITSSHQTQLTDSYYADLAAWLEMTGYHDIDFRNAKLRTYKERKSLEEEAARIAERLEKLRKEEQAEMEALRSSTAHPSNGPASSALPPPLPASMPSEDSAKMAAVAQKHLTNGTKRPHSPAPMERNNKRREDLPAPPARPSSGFKIRGANDSPTSPRAMERRISYPDVRRGSTDDRRGCESRDPSLERRQRYYARDGERPEPPPAWRSSRQELEYPSPRDSRGLPPPRSFATRGGSSIGGGGRGDYGRGHPYRGSHGLELAKGGTRYFILKSWNAGNVEAAQRDCVWSTQAKNESLLRDAFHSSRHVILFFSVNRSMAFQGYAIMTSPPDPNLPKPAAAAKLNWPTSAAFSLRWLSTTPVHFRLVGHLKNEFNLDDDGKPRAVLVGKDGQEVCEPAGRGLVEILDDVEVKEGRRG